MRDGDGEFEAFVEARWTALVRYAYALTGDRGHAEDVVQAALEKCWRRWRHVRPEGAEAYVRTAVVRLVISRRRVRSWHETPLVDAGVGEPVPGLGADEEIAVRDALWRELRELPPRMRAAVVLRFVEDLSEAQTAAALGCSVGTVKSQCSRGLERLRERAALRDAVTGTERGVRR